jgi:hypothetical protein
MGRKERQRGARRENRHERRQQQHSGGGEWDCIRLPEGLEVFKPEAGETYNIDVIPYIVGKFNKNADPGDEYFELGYPVYRDLGLEQKKFVAIGALLGVPDPVAELFAELRRKDAEWDDMKIYKPTWRQIMLLYVHEQKDKGLQFFEGAYGTLGELLDEELKAASNRNADGEGYIDNFDDPDHGATLEVRFKSKNIGQTNPWVLASKINFHERKKGFTGPDEVLEKAASICLDDCLKIPTYDELKAALEGRPTGNENSGDDEDEGRGRRTRRPRGGDEDDEKPAKEEKKPKAEEKPAKRRPTAESLGITKGIEVDHDKHGRGTVIKVAADGFSVTIMDGDDEVHKEIDPTDLEPVEAGGAEPGEPSTAAQPAGGSGGAEKPESASPAAKKSPSKDADDEEAPAPKKSGGKAKETAKPAEKEDDDWDKDWEN